MAEEKEGSRGDARGSPDRAAERTGLAQEAKGAPPERRSPANEAT
jgi:hypothetical protein